MNNKYYIETYGCQMNVYDSELVASFLEKSGYQSTSDYNNADVVFLNTCSIRDNAENTVHRKLENLAHLKKQNPKMMIGVLGCMAQNLKNDLMESKPYVDIVLGPDSYRKIHEILENRNKTNGHYVDTKLSNDIKSGKHFNPINSTHLNEANKENFDLQTYKQFLSFIKFQEMMDKYNT